jgi:signal transduction histidine kinase
MIWTWLLMFCRPVWQLAIVVLYSFTVHSAWEMTVLSIGGAMFIATNLILLMFLGDGKWNIVRKWALVVEQVGAGVLSLVMLWEWPLGPAFLLVLPTIVTYAWLFYSDKLQWMMTLQMLLVFILGLGRVQPERHTDFTVPIVSDILPWLIIGMYAAVFAFGTSVAFLVQRQRYKSESLMEALEKLEEQSQHISKINQQLSEYANQVYELATAEERNRIAGEIHDTVAHRLTALLVQLQAARRLMEREMDRDSVSANLQVCEALARESLDEVRYSVRAIRRSSDTEGLDVLRRLIVHYAALTGMGIEYSIEPGLGDLPAQMIAILYRVIQEALTNSQRHGRATRVTVSLKRVGVHLVLDIADNGRGTAHVTPGFGIASMRDRIQKMGGVIRTESRAGQGFSLQLQLPIWEGVSG